MDGTRLELTATGVAPVVAPKARTSTWSALVVPVVVDMPTVDRTDVEVVPGGALVRIGGRTFVRCGTVGEGACRRAGAWPVATPSATRSWSASRRP